MWTILWLALMLVNGITFCLWGLDKHRAKRSAWRIRERDLLALAALGGTGGAYLGRWLFRHKNRKPGFSAQLHGVAALQATALIGWLILR